MHKSLPASSGLALENSVHWQDVTGSPEMLWARPKVSESLYSLLGNQHG